MRQVLEPDAAGGDRGIAIVGHDVAAAHLEGVDAQRGGGAVDQVLADGVADRVADGAVLRGRGLVEIDDGGARLEMLVPVGPAGDVEDLVGLEHAGARILRIGAGARQHVDVQAQDLAGPAHGHARLDEVLAGMDVGDERLEAVGDELDGSAERDGGGRRRHLVAIGVDLEAERAADVGGDDLHVVIGDAQRLREHALDHVRALAAGVDGELAGALVVGGKQRARFQADGGMAAEVKGVLDDEVGVRRKRPRHRRCGWSCGQAGSSRSSRWIAPGMPHEQASFSSPPQPGQVPPHSMATRWAGLSKYPVPRPSRRARPPSGAVDHHGLCRHRLMPGKQVSMPSPESGPPLASFRTEYMAPATPRLPASLHGVVPE